MEANSLMQPFTRMLSRLQLIWADSRPTRKVDASNGKEQFGWTVELLEASLERVCATSGVNRGGGSVDGSRFFFATSRLHELKWLWICGAHHHNGSSSGGGWQKTIEVLPSSEESLDLGAHDRLSQDRLARAPDTRQRANRQMLDAP